MTRNGYLTMSAIGVVFFLCTASTFAAAPPKIRQVSPSIAPVWGGTPIMITGKRFEPGTTVQFGALSALDVVVLDSETISATTPAVPRGATTIRVTNSDMRTATEFFEFVHPGDGVFVVDRSMLPEPGIVPGKTVLADLDNDGDLDLYVPSNVVGSSDRLYFNNGAGNFTDVTSTNLPASLATGGHYEAAYADLDGDDDYDIVLTGRSMTYPARNAILINDGAGVFTDETAVRFPFDWLSSSIALGDIDADGDVDIFYGKNGTSYSYLLLLNDGYGYFTDVSATQLPDLTQFGSCHGVELADLDGDFDLDIVANPYTSPVMLLLNDGSGLFTDASANMPASIYYGYDLAVADIDDDSDLDVVFSNANGSPKLAINDGNGVFTDGTDRIALAGMSRSTDIAAADFDGDGDVDLLISNLYGAGTQNRYYQNDGTGWFVDMTDTNLPAELTNDTGFTEGDVDMDGDLDVIVSRTNETVIYFNQP